jgi:ribosomal protein L37AE/L43A
VNPPAICPVCKRTREFHDDEMEQIADGSAACAECGLELAQAAFIDGIAMGTIEAPPELLGKEEDD